MLKSNLKYLLKRENVSINQLSKDTGISRKSLTQLANNTGEGIQFGTINKLLDYFNINLDELIFNEASKTTIEFNCFSIETVNKIKPYIVEENTLPILLDVIVKKENKKEAFHIGFEAHIITDEEKTGENTIYGFSFQKLKFKIISQTDIEWLNSSGAEVEGYTNYWLNDECNRQFLNVASSFIEKRTEEAGKFVYGWLYPINCGLAYTLGSLIALNEEDLDMNLKYGYFCFCSWRSNPLEGRIKDSALLEFYTSMPNLYKPELDSAYRQFSDGLKELWIPNSVKLEYYDYLEERFLTNY